MLRKGVLSVFVFDGPGGPAWKRGRETGHSKGTVTQLERGFTALPSRMGIDWRKAPGEADAELAVMCQFGMIDAVLTVSDLGLSGNHRSALTNLPFTRGRMTATPSSSALPKFFATLPRSCQATRQLLSSTPAPNLQPLQANPPPRPLPAPALRPSTKSPPTR